MMQFLLLGLLFAQLPADPIEQQLKKFVDVYSVVEREAADPVAPGKGFYEGAIPGMLRRLDPHSVFFDPGQFDQLKEMERSTRKGFGSVVSLVPGRVIVLQTSPGTPSSKAGLIPGDEILAINGIRLDRLEFEELIGLLGEARQHTVRIDVRRPGSPRLLDFLLTPAEVDTPSVERTFLLRPGVGYIRVSSFDALTGKQIGQAIEKLGGAKLSGLVLDLRNNPGGLLPAALETASLFLKPKQRILSVKGRSVKGEEINVPDSAIPYEFPLSVLVNAKSASASEIVAGSLQDHKRAAIVGERSFGKGLVQSVFPLSSGTGMALTTAFYYTPGGRSIQRHLSGQLDVATTRKDEGGIQPDVPVTPSRPTRLQTFLDATGSFTSFATDYISRNRRIVADFEASNAVLDEFQTALSAKNVRPGIAEWSQEREWIRKRLRQEILNQAVGVEKGDEVEAQLDAQVQAALQALAIP
ncbi:MAG TPA: S41 family peptidase [Bryobacteraceae bacterium]|nr:S41 family peptidase [Bryobacteraceae bacterium]